MAKCAVIVVAAGSGARFGASLPKQYHDLDGQMVLRRSLAMFAAHPEIKWVRTAINPDFREFYDEAARGLNILDPIVGGKTRQESVRLGLLSLEELKPDIVLIHDGARPFVDSAIISNVIDALKEYKGAIPALPVNDTLKKEKGKTVIGETVDRTGLWRAQTPQGFVYADILAAHKKCEGLELTDDAAVAEHCGIIVTLTQGNENNFKITSRQDLERARNVLSRTPEETRMATGFDVHRFGEGTSVCLCGVPIPHNMGLLGHSDADVALHAITDAILGTIGAGDIGLHFPPSDMRWKGANSQIFAQHAVNLLRGLGGEIVHLDLTLICEKPKIGPNRAAMIRKCAEIFAIPQHRVSIKATTTEGLGFTGRGEGIAAQAAVTIRIQNTGISNQT